MQIKNGIVQGVLRVLNKIIAKDIEAESVTADSFIGDLTGNATKATQDSDGKQINTTYVKKSNQNDINGLINSLSTGGSAPSDDDYFISQYVNGGTTTTTYHRRPFSALWSYIKGKTDNLYAMSEHTHNYIPTSASCNKNWNWSGQSGQPTWLWGGNDGSNMYVYNPSNFSVSHASSANWAKYDQYEQNIASTYVHGLSIYENTITYTRGDGDESSFNVPDSTFIYNDENEIGRGIWSDLYEDSFNSYVIQFDNGAMIQSYNICITGSNKQYQVIFPVSFINSRYTTTITQNKGEAGYFNGCVMNASLGCIDIKMWGDLSGGTDSYVEGQDYISLTLIGRWK